MSDCDSSLPCPCLPIQIEIQSDRVDAVDCSALPAKPGVFVLEDGNGGTLALAVTANLRRLVSAKLQPIDPAAGPTRRVDYGTLARRVLATPVGSLFEAEWAYLQLARRRMPQTYRGLLDHWQAWFVRCDPEAPFPQFIKTAHPESTKNSTEVFLGPFPEKHAVGRYIELLQDAFDLCRYHHILVQAPRGTACAYKEMGRCSAPCDGTVSMDSYHQLVREAIAFACTPIEEFRGELEQSMKIAGERFDFESAGRLHETLERTKPATKPEFARVDRLEHFAFVALTPSEKKSWARLFAILGGWIAPVLEIPMDASSAQLEEIVQVIRRCQAERIADFSSDGIENIGLVCRHLFRPRAGKALCEFMRLDDQLHASTLKSSLRKLAKPKSEPDESVAITDQEIDNPATH